MLNEAVNKLSNNNNTFIGNHAVVITFSKINHNTYQVKKIILPFVG